MDFDRLSRAVKFGKAPQSEVEGLVSHHSDEHLNPHQASDHALADFLAEHGDPREHIVRGDLHLRSLPGAAWYDKLHARRTELFGPGYYQKYGQQAVLRGDHDTLSVQPITDHYSGRTAYHVGWAVNYPQPTGGFRNNRSTTYYSAVLEHPQVADLYRHFGQEPPAPPANAPREADRQDPTG